jgi:4,5-DOPA dioxygenase extradiol
LTHGGRNLPLLGDTNHQEMIKFMYKSIPRLGVPESILIISAHWEEGVVTITSRYNPSLIYDYYGFPEESYQLEYPAPGEPVLVNKISDLLRKNGFESKLSDKRGFDHGIFVPLKILFPEENIPCVQLSFLNNLDPESHLKIGKALSKLRTENTLTLVQDHHSIIWSP